MFDDPDAAPLTAHGVGCLTTMVQARNNGLSAPNMGRLIGGEQVKCKFDPCSSLLAFGYLLLAGFSWRFLFSFGSFLKVFDAGRVFATCLVHMLVTALCNAFLFCVNIGVEAGFFSGHEVLLI